MKDVKLICDQLFIKRSGFCDVLLNLKLKNILTYSPPNEYCCPPLNLQFFISEKSLKSSKSNYPA